jgi:hypothetical protein
MSAGHRPAWPWGGASLSPTRRTDGAVGVAGSTLTEPGDSQRQFTLRCPGCPPRPPPSAWAGCPAPERPCCRASWSPCAASDPDLNVVSREGGTPALVRALRAGSLDLALLASAPPFRPPDAESPPLVLRTLVERPLYLAVPATHPPARAEFVDVADLRGQRWIAGSSSGEDRLMGVWPGPDERPEIAHTARDWLAKLQLVAAGRGLTAVSASLAPAVPPGVRVLPVRGGPQEQRRLLLARLPGPPAEAVTRVASALRLAALDSADQTPGGGGTGMV